MNDAHPRVIARCAASALNIGLEELEALLGIVEESVIAVAKRV